MLSAHHCKVHFNPLHSLLHSVRMNTADVMKINMVKKREMKKFRFNNSFVFIITIVLLLLLRYILHFAVELNARRHEHLVTVINFFLPITLLAIENFTAFSEFIISSAWLNIFFIANLTRENAVFDVNLNEIWWKILA